MTTRTWPAVKDPDEIKEYQLLWHKLLKDDTIIADPNGSVWAVPSSSGLTVESSSKTETVTTVWLSGGRTGTYDVVNTVITDGGRTYQQTVRLVVRDK